MWFCAYSYSFTKQKRTKALVCKTTCRILLSKDPQLIPPPFLSAVCLSYPTALIFCFFPPCACLLLDFIYVHPPSKPCDGFSAAMLNFTDRSTPQLRARLYDPAPSAWCAGDLAPPETGVCEKKRALLCEQEARRRWSRGKGREDESNLGVPWEWTSWLLCFLIPLSTEQQGGGGEGAKGYRGWWGWRNCVFTPKGSRRGQCNSICTCQWFYLCYKLKVQMGWCLMITK